METGQGEYISPEWEDDGERKETIKKGVLVGLWLMEIGRLAEKMRLLSEVPCYC